MSQSVVIGKGGGGNARPWRTSILSVGLTGGIGAGKSLALEFFEAGGAVVVSADAIVHAAYELPEIKAAVVSRFGGGIVRPDGSIDRHAVASRVFSRPRDLEFLESILHPVVRRHLTQVIASVADGRVVVAEVPLLFEAGWQDLFDVTVTMSADSIVRYHRTEHAFSDADFAIREALQLADDERRALADYFFDNSGGKAALAVWVEGLLESLRETRLGIRTGGAEDIVVDLAAPVTVVDALALAEEALESWGDRAPAVLTGPVAAPSFGMSTDWRRVPPGGRCVIVMPANGGGGRLVVMGGHGVLRGPDGSAQDIRALLTVILEPGASYELANSSEDAPLVTLEVVGAVRSSA